MHSIFKQAVYKSSDYAFLNNLYSKYNLSSIKMLMELIYIKTFIMILSKKNIQNHRALNYVSLKISVKKSI